MDVSPDNKPREADADRSLQAAGSFERATFDAEEVAQRLCSLLPPEVMEVYGTLKEAGYGAFLFGGAVRDSALGENPKDWDVAADAPSDVIRRLFPRAVEFSFEPGTFLLRERGEDIEITPIAEKFRGSIRGRLEADNEITFNSMAFDFEEKRVLDFFRGLDALKRRSIEVPDPPGIRLDITVRLARFAAAYDTRSFTVEARTLHAAKSLVEGSPRLLDAPEFRTWKALRSLHYGFASPDVVSAFGWWERLGLLTTAFFPEFKDSKELLFRAAAEVSSLPVEDRLRGFLARLPEEKVLLLKERTGTYLLPPVRFLIMDRTMRRTLEPVIPRVCDLVAVFYPPAPEDQESYMAESRFIEDLACAGHCDAAFQEWMNFPRAPQRQLLFLLPLPLAVQFVAEKTKRDLQSEPWDGAALHWFKDLLSYADQPHQVMNLVFKVLLLDPNTDLRSLILLYGYWGNLCCDREILLEEPVRSKVAEAVRESAEDGSLVNVLKKCDLLRWFMLNLREDEFARFVDPYAALLSDQHRSQQGASFETFTWMSENGDVPDWANLLLDTLRSQHARFCRTQELPPDHVWRIYPPSWELAEDWGMTVEGEFARVKIPVT